MNLRNFSTEFGLALRYLKPQRNAVSVITCISVLGVMLGVAVLIVVLAVMTGFTDMWKEKLLDTTSHFQVTRWSQSYNAGQVTRSSFIPNPTEVITQIKQKIPGSEAVEIVETPVLIQQKGRFEPKLLIGINPYQNKKADELAANLLPGSKFSLEKGEVILSDRIAAQLGVFRGDKILIHSPSRLAKMVEVNEESGKIELSKNAEISLPMEFTVSGIYNFNKYDFDSQVLFVGIDDADELLGIPWGAATSVYGWVRDPFQMTVEMEALRTLLPGYGVMSWEEKNQNFLGVLQMEKTMMFFLLVFIVLVAAFSIMNTLITVVVQKTREIGILKSLGATSGAVMRVFIFQGLIVGLTGNCCGMALGILVVTFRNEILSIANTIRGADLFPAQFYFFNQLPGRIVPEDLLVIGIVSVVLCTFGAVIPAYRAARLDPARALRYE